MSKWSEIPDDVKKEVVKLLKYEDRCNLKICSKSDNVLVKTTKFVPSKISITETLSQFSDEKTIIRIDIDSFSIWFIGKGDFTKIDRGWNGEIIGKFTEFYEKNRYNLVIDFLNRISYNGMIKAGEVEVDSLKLLPPPHWKFNFHKLTLIDVPRYRVWLQKLNPGNLKKLHVALEPAGNVAEEISQLKISESLNLYHCQDVRDEHLQGVTATNLRIFQSKVSADWIKMMLENHLKNGNETNEFSVIQFFTDANFNPLNYIPKSLVVRRDAKDGYSNDAFLGKIIGGFQNVHGIQTRRRLSIMPYSSGFSISCRIHKKPEGPFEEI